MSDPTTPATPAAPTTLQKIEASIDSAVKAQLLNLKSAFAAEKVKLEAAGANVAAAAKTFLISNILPIMQTVDNSALTGAQKLAAVETYLKTFYTEVVLPEETSSGIVGWIESEVASVATTAGFSWLVPLIQYMFNTFMATPATPATPSKPATA